MGQKKQSGKCIFCGGGQLSREHIWPSWMKEYLPVYPNNYRQEQFYTFTNKTHLASRSPMLKRQGHTYDKTLRVVCQSCNNGWMSKVEEEAKSILLPLLKSQSFIVNSDAQIILARWMALKMMVAENSQADFRVTPQEERNKLKSSLALPENFKVWIAKCELGGGWDAGYLRHSATLTLPSITEIPKGKNIHSVAIGMSNLFLFAMHSTMPNILEHISFSKSQIIFQVYPIGPTLWWPPTRTLSTEDATKAADSLNAIISQPNVVWKPSL